MFLDHEFRYTRCRTRQKESQPQHGYIIEMETRGEQLEAREEYDLKVVGYIVLYIINSLHDDMIATRNKWKG
jgi:hypothetical protein